MKRLLPIITAALVAGCSSTSTVTAPPAGVPLESQAAAPASVTRLSTSPYPLLKEKIDALIPDSLFPPSNIAVKIRSLSRDETLYDLNGGLILNPASNMKLFTSATALHELGTAYQFTTRVSADTAGTPTIVVRGSGDPIMVSGDLDTLAARTAAALPQGKTWRLAGDVSLFDDLPMGEGWPWDDESYGYQMQLSPLSVNANCVDVRTEPGAKAGDPVRVSVDPPNTYVTVDNQGVTVADSAVKPLEAMRRSFVRNNVITVSGELPLGSRSRTEKVTVHAPHLYFLSLFADRLRNRNVAVGETVLDTVRPRAFPVAELAHGLDTVVVYLNKVSDNLSAENILRTMAAERLGKPGSADKGHILVNGWLNAAGVDTSRLVLSDGSGLSRYNLVSASSLISLLTAMRARTDLHPLFLKSLPVAGVDGTIGRRMNGTRAEGNLRAKTGTLSDVTSLSGYVTTADGEELAFSILMQKYPWGSRAYRAVQDQIGVLLASLTRNDFASLPPAGPPVETKKAGE